LKKAAELAQKKYLALKTEVKKEDDKKAAALEMAKEEEQAREDKKNEHKLDSKKKLELVNKIKEFTSFVKTDDPAENKKLKKAGIKAA